MKAIVDAGWGPAPSFRDGVSTRILSYALPGGELTITLQRRGAWADKGAFIYQEAYFLPRVCGVEGCWSDRVKLEIVIEAERTGDEALPPRVE